MKLSTKGRYGVRLMLDLAMNFDKGPVYLKDIAKRQEISEKYLWQLISVLKNAGLVNSERGAKGGYFLARHPGKITLRDIVPLLEGDLCLVDCINNPLSCKKVDTCVARDVWKQVSDVLLNKLESFTLENLVEKQKNKSGNLNYVI